MSGQPFVRVTFLNFESLPIDRQIPNLASKLKIYFADKGNLVIQELCNDVRENCRTWVEIEITTKKQGDPAIFLSNAKNVLG